MVENVPVTRCLMSVAAEGWARLEIGFHCCPVIEGFRFRKAFMGKCLVAIKSRRDFSMSPKMYFIRS